MKRHTFAILLIISIFILALTACSDKKDDKPEADSTPERVADAAPAGDAQRGATLFQSGKGDDSPPCSACHKVSSGGSGFALGPVLAGISEHGATRVSGMSAPDYIRNSILHPQSFVVPGFRVSMYPDYARHLSGQDVDDLVAYLMTL